MINKLPGFSDKHKICIICEGNEEYEYLNRLKDLKVWNEQYDFSLVNAGGNGNIPARYQDRYQNGSYLKVKIVGGLMVSMKNLKNSYLKRGIYEKTR